MCCDQRASSSLCGRTRTDTDGHVTDTDVADMRRIWDGQGRWAGRGEEEGKVAEEFLAHV